MFHLAPKPEKEAKEDDDFKKNEFDFSKHVSELRKSVRMSDRHHKVSYTHIGDFKAFTNLLNISTKISGVLDYKLFMLGPQGWG